MGVDITVLEFLLRSRRHIRGHTLQLGRQGLHVGREAVETALRAYGDNACFDAVAQPDGYTEALFRHLGSAAVSSMDVSTFEGASLIHDLNLSVPLRLEGKFDVIFDGGTIEHVYDLPQAFTNIHRMLAQDGVLLSVNAANNQLGHGFYQFSPELMWRVFGPDAGYHVLSMQIASVSQQFETVDAPDPAVLKHRMEIGTTLGAAYLLLASCKRDSERRRPMPQQSDYASAWQQSTDRSSKEEV